MPLLLLLMQLLYRRVDLVVGVVQVWMWGKVYS